MKIELTHTQLAELVNETTEDAHFRALQSAAEQLRKSGCYPRVASWLVTCSERSNGDAWPEITPGIGLVVRMDPGETRGDLDNLSGADLKRLGEQVRETMIHKGLVPTSTNAQVRRSHVEQAVRAKLVDMGYGYAAGIDFGLIAEAALDALKDDLR